MIFLFILFVDKELHPMVLTASFNPLSTELNLQQFTV